MTQIDRDDPVLARLRSLPPHLPDGALDSLILEAGRSALAGETKSSGGEGWAMRMLVPTLLSATTLSYLWWAVRAASALYS